MDTQDYIDLIDPTQPINPPTTKTAPKPTAASVRANFAAGKNALQSLLDLAGAGAAADLASLLLTGVSFASSAWVAATDNALVALGKLQAQLSLHAPLDSPALTGTPTAPTAPPGTDTTQMATTAFVQAAANQPLTLTTMGTGGVATLTSGGGAPEWQAFMGGAYWTSEFFYYEAGVSPEAVGYAYNRYARFTPTTGLAGAAASQIRITINVTGMDDADVQFHFVVTDSLGATAETLFTSTYSPPRNFWDGQDNITAVVVALSGPAPGIAHLDIRTSSGPTYAVTHIELYALTSGGGKVLNIPDYSQENAATLGPDGKLLPGQVPDHLLEAMKFPLVLDANIALWQALASAYTASSIGFEALVTSGTIMPCTVANTTPASALKRLRYKSDVAAGSVGGHYQQYRQYTLGGPCGFTYSATFCCADIAPVAGARQFVGLAASTTYLSNVNPATLTNLIGLAKLADSENLHLVHAGTAAQPPVDLGVDFPASGDTLHAYRLRIVSNPASEGNALIEVRRLGTAFSCSTPLDLPGGIALPSATTLLAHRAWRCNNATALACGLSISTVYFGLNYSAT